MKEMDDVVHETRATRFSGWVVLPIWLLLVLGAAWLFFGPISVGNGEPGLFVLIFFRRSNILMIRMFLFFNYRTLSWSLFLYERKNAPHKIFKICNGVFFLFSRQKDIRYRISKNIRQCVLLRGGR